VKDKQPLERNSALFEIDYSFLGCDAGGFKLTVLNIVDVAVSGGWSIPTVAKGNQETTAAAAAAFIRGSGYSDVVIQSDPEHGVTAVVESAVRHLKQLGINC